MVEKFKVGDEVIYNGTEGYVGEIKQGGYLFFWSNDPRWAGSCGSLIPQSAGYSFSYALNQPIPVSEMKKKVIKPPTFDLKAMDQLVVAKETKDEIEAVLKQHKHSDKLFIEWGLAETIQYGKGMTFLFYGPPGTGKTWAAHCIAKVVGKELLSIGGAEIHSSEPGAANRNIQEAFANAKKKGKILFIDECDSLITTRSDVGMIIGGEINTLLTEIEKTEGIVILATNQVESLDPALERRISLIVEFPEPNYEQRLAIFKNLVPAKLPLHKDVKLDKLAEHKLTGGQIKNVILQAARLALSTESDKVALSHFESAISRVQASKNLLGQASRYRQGIIKENFGVGKKRDTTVTDKLDNADNFDTSR